MITKVTLRVQVLIMDLVRVIDNLRSVKKKDLNLVQANIMPKSQIQVKVLKSVKNRKLR